MKNHLIGYLYICHFSLSKTYVSYPEKEYKQFRPYHMRNAIACAYLYTCLKRLRHAFFSTSETDINLSRPVVFCKPRGPANVLELRTPK